MVTPTTENVCTESLLSLFPQTLSSDHMTVPDQSEALRQSDMSGGEIKAGKPNGVEQNFPFGDESQSNLVENLVGVCEARDVVIDRAEKGIVGNQEEETTLTTNSDIASVREEDVKQCNNVEGVLHKCSPQNVSPGKYLADEYVVGEYLPYMYDLHDDKKSQTSEQNEARKHKVCSTHHNVSKQCLSSLEKLHSFSPKVNEEETVAGAADVIDNYSRFEPSRQKRRSCNLSRRTLIDCEEDDKKICSVLSEYLTSLAGDKESKQVGSIEFGQKQTTLWSAAILETSEEFVHKEVTSCSEPGDLLVVDSSLLQSSISGDTVSEMKYSSVPCGYQSHFSVCSCQDSNGRRLQHHCYACQKCLGDSDLKQLSDYKQTNQVLKSAQNLLLDADHNMEKKDKMLTTCEHPDLQVLFHNDKNKENTVWGKAGDNRSISLMDSQVSSRTDSDSDSSKGGVDIYINELHYSDSFDDEEDTNQNQTTYHQSDHMDQINQNRTADDVDGMADNQQTNKSDDSTADNQQTNKSDDSTADNQQTRSDDSTADNQMTRSDDSTADNQMTKDNNPFTNCCLLRDSKTYRSTSLLNKLYNDRALPPKTFTCPCISMLDGRNVSLRKRTNTDKTKQKARPNSCSFITNGSMEKEIHIGQKRFSLYNFDQVLPEFWDRESSSSLSRTNSCIVNWEKKEEQTSFTLEKLHQRSKEDLHTLHEQIKQQVQVVSEQLVDLLQKRHELVEQVEMRRIAVEQLGLLRPELKEKIQMEIQEAINKHKQYAK